MLAASLLQLLLYSLVSIESAYADFEPLSQPGLTVHNSAPRSKRFVVRKKRWRKSLLTWRLASHNINEGDAYLIRNTLHRAFREWESVSSVRFRETTGRTDIVVGFERGAHQDAFPFDGPDGVVAHAFYPRDGRLHFDADEDWTLNSQSGVNLYQTAVHEIGHLLGLEHSGDPRAAMLGAKRPYDPEFALGDDDVRGIRVLFPLEKANGKDVLPVISKDTNKEKPTLSEVVENLGTAMKQTKAPATTQPASEATASEMAQFPFDPSYRLPLPRRKIPILS